MVAWSLLQVDNNYLQLSETAVGLKWWQTCGSSGQDKQASSNMLSFSSFDAEFKPWHQTMPVSLVRLDYKFIATRYDID